LARRVLNVPADVLRKRQSQLLQCDELIGFGTLLEQGLRQRELIRGRISPKKDYRSPLVFWRWCDGQEFRKQAGHSAIIAFACGF
jgi:hypothetical protein